MMSQLLIRERAVRVLLDSLFKGFLSFVIRIHLPVNRSQIAISD
jgi:hypothetical protein